VSCFSQDDSLKVAGVNTGPVLAVRFAMCTVVRWCQVVNMVRLFLLPV